MWGRVMNNLYLDCEFTGLCQDTSLISMAMLDDTGKRGFYAEFTDYEREQVDQWLTDNVFSQLYLGELEPGVEARMSFAGGIWNYRGPAIGPNEEGTYLFRDFLDNYLARFDQVRIWTDVGAYDWMLFCQVFGGGAECLPRNVCYIPADLATLFLVKGLDPDLNRIEFSGLSAVRHNALADVRVMRLCHQKVEVHG